MNEQLRAIEAGADIVTGTPGRIKSLIEQEQLRLNHVRFFVLDEAVSDRRAGKAEYSLWKK